jgi:SAM-dependent methyltransferase
MPLFVADLVGRVITIDYAQALEPRTATRARASAARGVPHVAASMLDMPFAPGSFDLVTCISTIEHLDDLGNGRQVARDEFLARTRTAIRQMAAVLRPGGYLYITTDACIPELQPIDSWSRKRAPGDVRWSIYGVEDIEGTFLDEARSAGLQVISSGDFSAQTLIEDEDRSSYRGRYCTTFILFACKLP